MFAGTVGIYTAHRPKGYALSINERTTKTSQTSFLANLLLLFTGSAQLSILARDTLTFCPDYKCAFDRFTAKHNLIAGGYIILAGIEEGAIITRDRQGAVDISVLKTDERYILETN
jgi:hypothetical protein